VQCPGLGLAFLLIAVFFVLPGKAHPVQLAHCNYDADQATLGLTDAVSNAKVIFLLSHMRATMLLDVYVRNREAQHVAMYY